MQRLASTITPYMPGTREVFMSPKLSYLSVDVYRETGEAYLYNGCAIVDRRSGVADMSIKDAQAWCMQYERSLWEAAHEDAITEDAERAGFSEVPVTTPVERDEIERDIEDLIDDRVYYMQECKRLAVMARTYDDRGMRAMAAQCRQESAEHRASARDCTASLKALRERLSFFEVPVTTPMDNVDTHGMNDNDSHGRCWRYEGTKIRVYALGKGAGTRWHVDGSTGAEVLDTPFPQDAFDQAAAELERRP